MPAALLTTRSLLASTSRPSSGRGGGTTDRPDLGGSQVALQQVPRSCLVLAFSGISWDSLISMADAAENGQQ